MEILQNVDIWVWATVVVVALIVIGVLVAFGKRRRQAWEHSRAEAMRSHVEKQLPDLRKHEAAAIESETQAERARADAERLEAQATERRREVEEERTALAEQLREADERDPEVDTDAGAHRDEDDSLHRD